MIETHSEWWARVRRERLPKRERFKELSNHLKSRRLAVQIVDAGYRSLAMKHHPDAGGSHEDMIALTQARDELRRKAAGM
jgi:uncharacterized coiled-coil DUF342 family protein